MPLPRAFQRLLAAIAAGDFPAAALRLDALRVAAIDAPPAELPRALRLSFARWLANDDSGPGTPTAADEAAELALASASRRLHQARRDARDAGLDEDRIDEIEEGAE